MRGWRLRITTSALHTSKATSATLRRPHLSRLFHPSPTPSTTPMADIETAKRNAAIRAVADHFDPSFRYIGIGSGTTIVYVVEAITNLGADTSRINFVPTGYQSRQVIVRAGLTPIAFDSLPKGVLMDVAFDGADEIDEDLNCIKGGGACLYQEKLVATHARKFVCVADHRKLQKRLLTKWPTIPIEVEPLAAFTVLEALEDLGSKGPFIREGHIIKAGPIKTDQDNFIVDAPFPTLLIPSDLKHSQSDGKTGRGEGGVWVVEALAKEIKALEGVLSVGLFVGFNGAEAAAWGKKLGGQKPVAAYFGMMDGEVIVRTAKDVQV
ncbi:MAG: ribose 5-phosphate isomerase A [Lasallia pustulata]|uniref:Ribose-5-phosphate isomerase n=1 Tax=Lasallia pustulata TaxID=136370 RepID=A0A5M8PC15_9LECA|nr:MAG: ribose 5-phosphate isomerase A [Lasallia pustulata]